MIEQKEVNIFWRNPRLYVRELAEMRETNILFDQGMIVKYRMKPLAFAHSYFGQAAPYRLIIVNNACAPEYNATTKSLDKPVAVYPVWRYGDEADYLEELLALPVGADADMCSDLTTPRIDRPVFGQEHRVIVRMPNGNSPGGRVFLGYLRDMQQKYPDAIIHMNGIYGYTIAFGHGIAAADLNPRDDAAQGRVYLPTGKRVEQEKLEPYRKWVTMMGYDISDMQVPRNRCMFNIASARWAAKNYMSAQNVRQIKAAEVDTETPEQHYKTPLVKLSISPKAKFQPNDKILCSMCSVALHCKHFRDKAVCSLPDAEPTSLAKFFGTRDSASIIDGLTTLVAFNARRLERGAAAEEYAEELDPDVTKLANSVFEQGVKLAKLIDPTLRTAGTKINILNGSVGGSGTTLASSTPQELTGGIVRALEQQGIARADITPEMVAGVLSGMADPTKAKQAIEGKVIDGA